MLLSIFKRYQKGPRDRSLSLLLTILLPLGVFFSSTALFAKALPHQPSYTHIANNQPLPELLRGFAAQLSIPVVISDQVSGNVNGRFSDRPTAFMNKLSQLFNIIWYYDGTTLYVYSDGETKTRIIKVHQLTVGELKQNLKRLGILDAKSKWQSLPRQSVAYVSGPPRYVDLAAEVAKVLDESASTRRHSRNYVVEIFPLKYALAYDRQHTIRGRSVVIKGVATILRNLLGQTSLQNLQTGGDQQGRQATLPGGAMVAANERINAVIISDREENMEMYSELIDRLDVPSSQVEINVSIIEVSIEKLEKLGIEVKHSGDNGSISFGNPAAAFSGGGAGSGLPPQTLIVAKAGDFLGRVNLLSQDGNAKILSRPSVLTVDKVEAVIDNSSTFYVRVAGKDDAQLFPVTVGTMVRVTPRIVLENDGRWVHLDIEIEDGTQDENVKVDAIPLVKKSTINTNAIVAEDSSLLVGGYYYDRQSHGENKIPLLGDLPVFSIFFNWESSTVRKMARMFLITPRIISHSDTNNKISATDILSSFRKLKSQQVPTFSSKNGLKGVAP